MSGFITIYNTDGEPVDEQLIYSLTHTLKFRGPDRQDVWVDGKIGMGHALFQTTNEAKYERQPSTLDEQVWITCSARIDDRENLVNKLGIKNQINLNNTPDSDLILHAYKKWGEDCLNHLLGDFAFVIWDEREKKLFCARDRFGMRQLYFAKKNKSFIICNSLDCMMKHSEISNEFNEKAIGGFLLFGDYTWMDKSMTMFSEITTLLAAHKLVLQNGEINIQQYWDIPKDIPLLHYRNKNDYIKHFQELFKQAVADRIRTPSVAISLSGGMDSSSVAATIIELQKEKKIPPVELNAVTIVYDHVMPCQERHYASLVAKHLNIPIHYIIGDKYPFIKPAIGTTRPLEISQPSLWMDSEKKFSELSRVVLTGNAGDNTITYPSASSVWEEGSIFNTISNMMKLQQLYGKRPPFGTGLRSKLNKILGNNNHNLNNAAYPYPTWINPDFEKRLDLKKEWKYMWSSYKEKQSMPYRHSRLQFSLSRPDWNTDDILMNTDFTLSENRDPFLDLRIVEFILALPALPWLFNKHILRQSMKNILPAEIIYRPKTPLGYLDDALLKKPENRWMNNWKPSAESLMYLKNKEIMKENINNEILSYLNSRTFILDLWLQNIKA